mmetsp:Transcript_6013/g.13694  ORF Transcript_6013/g.13694 Transcript_6013/m.13694 type:complete len:162 (-) Transcript_6013:57-542(-)
MVVATAVHRGVDEDLFRVPMVTKVGNNCGQNIHEVGEIIELDVVLNEMDTIRLRLKHSNAAPKMRGEKSENTRVPSHVDQGKVYCRTILQCTGYDMCNLSLNIRRQSSASDICVGNEKSTKIRKNRQRIKVNSVQQLKSKSTSMRMCPKGRNCREGPCDCG